LVEIYVRRRKPKPFGGLLLTFVVGVAIGFSVAYAFFRGGKPALPGGTAPPEPAPISAPVEAPVSPEAPITPPAEMPATEAGPVKTPLAETPTKAEEPLRPGLFLFLGIDGLTLGDETKALLSEVQPGGVVLKADDLSSVEAVTALVSQIKDAVGLGKGMADPPLIAVAQEGGTVNPLKIGNAPSAEELGQKKDSQAAREAGRACGEAAVKRGIGVLFAPVLNVREGKTKEGEKACVASDRVFGSDQGEVTLMGLAFANGISDAGAVPIAKYYPGIGLRREGENAAAFVINANSQRLAELMYPFSEAAAQGAPGIIVGHVAVPEVDRKIPNRPASISPVLVQTILRGTFHYEGLVLADDISSDAISAACSPDRALVESLAAGCDGALLFDARPERVRAACDALKNALDTGTLTQDRLIQSRQRWQALAERLATPPAAPKPEAPAAAENKADARTEPVSTPEPATVEAQPAPEPAAAQDVKPEQTPVPQPPNTEKIVHEIARGETLGKIAAKYGVKLADILAWNGRNDANIKYGYKLIIYRPIKESSAAKDEPQSEDKVRPVEEPAPEPATGAPAAVDEPPEAAPAAANDPAAVVPADAAASTGNETEQAETTLTHTVAKGETIYHIAAKYKTTVQRLIEMSKLGHRDHLEVGQKLRVPAPDAKQ
jgi:beta-N-acetylhexosaminidase